jgi:hypothetical protein
LFVGSAAVEIVLRHARRQANGLAEVVNGRAGVIDLQIGKPPLPVGFGILGIAAQGLGKTFQSLPVMPVLDVDNPLGERLIGTVGS